jgi:hypothetical protein
VLAQVSIEFTIFVSILVVLLLTTVFYNSTAYMQMASTGINIDAQSISDQIASEINLGIKAGDGYSRTFNLPYAVSNAFNYTVSVDNYLVILRWSNSSVQSTILTKSINGTILKGQNIIRNLNGNMYVNQ